MGTELVASFDESAPPLKSVEDIPILIEGKKPDRPSEVAKELTRLFGIRRTGKAVCTMLKIDKSQNEPITIEEEKYYRAGGECYILPFSISVGKTKFKALLKANVTMTADISTKNALIRRRLLENKGVKAPKLYADAAERAVILEEFLPYSLEEAYEKFGNNILPQIAHAHGVIAACGFQPVKNGLLRDFRADEQGNMQMIDFGADLGSPSDTPTNLWESFEEEVGRRLGVSNNVIQTLQKSYENGLQGSKNVPSSRLTI